MNDDIKLKKAVNMKKYIIVMAIIFIVCLLVKCISSQPYIGFDIKTSGQETLQVFFLVGDQEQYSEQHSRYATYNPPLFSEINFSLPSDTNISKIRLDFGSKDTTYYIKDFYIQKNLFKKIELTSADFIKIFGTQQNQIESFELVDNVIKVVTNGEDGTLVSDPNEFNMLSKRTTALDSSYFLYMVVFLVLFMIVIKVIFCINPFNKILGSILFFIAMCVLAFYQSGISYLLLKFLFVFSFQASFMFIIFRYDVGKNILAIIGIAILIIVANLPLITQGFLYGDDLFFFSWSQLSYGIGARRPLFFIICDYGMLLNYDNFNLFRLLVLSFFILFATSFYLFLQDISSRIMSFIITIVLTCSVVTVDIIGYATVFPVVLSLFLSLASFVVFEYAVKCGNSLHKISFLVISFIILFSSFCFYQIATPIIFTFIAISIILRALSLKHTIYYLLLYGMASIVYLPLTKLIMRFYHIAFAQAARGEFINSIQEVGVKIVFFINEVFPQAILRVISVFTGNSIFVNDNLFFSNTLVSGINHYVMILLIVALSILGIIFFYKKNKSLIQLFVLLALIPMSYYPFLLLKENGLMAYYLVPIIYLLTIYFAFIIAVIIQNISISRETKQILTMMLLSLIIIQSNYYAGKVWVTKNVLWYNKLRDDVCSQEKLYETRGGRYTSFWCNITDNVRTIQNMDCSKNFD